MRCDRCLQIIPEAGPDLHICEELNKKPDCEHCKDYQDFIDKNGLTSAYVDYIISLHDL